MKAVACILGAGALVAALVLWYAASPATVVPANEVITNEVITNERAANERAASAVARGAPLASEAVLGEQRQAERTRLAGMTDGDWDPLDSVKVLRGEDLTPIEGALVVETELAGREIGRWWTDTHGRVRLGAPAYTRLVAHAPGFCIAQCERDKRVHAPLVLRLARSSMLRGRLLNVPAGLTELYSLRVVEQASTLSAHALGIATLGRALVEGESFALECVTEGHRAIGVVGVHRPSGREVGIPIVCCEDGKRVESSGQILEPDQGWVELDLGGGVFRDRLARLTIRIHFTTPEPTGPLVVRMRAMRGGRYYELRGSRDPGQETVAVREPGAEVNDYEATVECADASWTSAPFKAEGDCVADIEVALWTSLLLHFCAEGPQPKKVWPTVCDCAGRPCGQLRQHPDGVWEVDNLPAGGCCVQARSEDPTMITDAVPVTLGERESKELSLALHRLHTARVGVFRADTAPGQVVIERDGREVQTLTYGQGSRWQQVELPPGRYVLTARFPSFVEQQRLDLFADRAEVRFEQHP